MNSRFLNALGATRLYPITDRGISGLSHAEQVSLLCSGGASVIQLREKSLAPRQFYQEAYQAVRRAHELGVKVIINDRVDIALAVEADGVHLGQDDVPVYAARKMLGADAIIGLSTHNLEQARIAIRFPVDYIAVGPIFTTSTKPNTHPEVGLEGLSRVRQAVDKVALVAIGGITSDNCHEVIAAGADAVAIISDLWNPPSHVVSRAQLIGNRL